MHSLRLIPFIVTLLVSVGCTKSPDVAESEHATQAAGPAAEPAKADARPVIVAFGDSLAEGFGVQPGLSFPDQLQQKLDAGGFSYRVANLGVSGDTTTGGLGRLDYALSLKPEIVILELGGNDGLRGIPVASTKTNLEKMIVAFQKSGTSIVLAGMTLPPNYGPEYIHKFEAAYKDLAAKYKVRLIPFLMEDILAQYKSRPGLMQQDGIHPSAEGHAIIADTVYRYLQPMLKKG